MAIISNPPKVFVIARSNHRAFDQIVNVLGLFALTQEAFMRRNGGAPPPGASNVMKLNCRRANMALHASLYGVINTIETGEPLNSINLCYMPKGESAQGFQVMGMQRLIQGVSGSSFAIYAERACDWIKSNITTNYHQWPPVANFCRVTRNAIVHGEKVNISSPTAPAVEWFGLKISHLDYDQDIFGQGYLGAIDLVILMLDLEDELNLLGAPFDLQ